MTQTEQYALSLMHDALIIASDFIGGNEGDYTWFEVHAKIQDAWRITSTMAAGRCEPTNANP